MPASGLAPVIVATTRGDPREDWLLADLLRGDCSPRRSWKRRRAQAAASLRRSRQPSVLRQRGRRIREPDRDAPRRRSGNEGRVLLLAASPRLHAEHHQGQGMRRPDGDSQGDGRVPHHAPVLPIQLPVRLPRRSRSRHHLARRSAAEEAQDRRPHHRLRLQQFAGGAVARRARHRRPHRLQHLLHGREPSRRDHRGAGRRQDRSRHRLGTHRRLLREAVTRAALTCPTARRRSVHPDPVCLRRRRRRAEGGEGPPRAHRRVARAQEGRDRGHPRRVQRSPGARSGGSRDGRTAFRAAGLDHGTRD